MRNNRIEAVAKATNLAAKAGIPARIGRYFDAMSKGWGSFGLIQGSLVWWEGRDNKRTSRIGAVLQLDGQ